MRGKLLNYKIIVFFALAYSLNSHSQINYNLKAMYRSTPAATNIVGTLIYEKLLWGEVNKKKPLYGYYKLGAVLGGSPTVGAFVEFSPIAPVTLKYQKSITYRFTKSSVFDCEKAYCFGVLDRNDILMSLAAGYDRVVGVASYLWRDIKAPESSNLVMSEQELFLTTPGSHFYNEVSLTAGYLFENKNVLGVHYTAGEISDQNRRSHSLYGIYHWKWNEIDLTVGAGRYDTDQADVAGSGVFFVIGKQFGERLSLF